ncbi:hypothetical protein JL721_8094 [Aureococcus anophagefferens]|nr:hypothetical protein JL721_8094 [Aureococcus anophagefferens]
MADQSLAAVDQAEMEQDLAMLESDAFMQRCDGILAKMQETLLGFEFDLGSASRELRSLQRESKRMSVKLRNRRATEARLGAFLAAVALSPDVAVAVCDGPVDERFLSAVTALDSTLRYARGGGEIKAGADAGWRAACVGARAVGDAAPLHDKLEQKASLGAGGVVESMAKTLHALFRAYHAALDKHDLEVANKFDVVAVEEHAMRSQFTSRVSLTKRGDGFSLGDRARVLDRLAAPPILVHVAIAEKASYPFEELFRSSLRHLADAAASELQFVSAFLYGGGRSDAVQATVAEIFAKALSATVEHLENKLFACHDVVGLLLVLRLVAGAAPRSGRDGRRGARRLLRVLRAPAEAAARRHPHGEPGQRRGGPAEPRAAGRAAALRRGATRSSTRPSPRCCPRARGARQRRRRRGGKEAHAFAARSASVGDLLGRLGGRSASKDRVVFLINNYDQILSIFLERGLEAGDDVAHFTAELARQRELFVNSDVSYFANFVNGMEVLKQVLTQLLYYTRFQDRPQGLAPPPPFAKNLGRRT